MVSNRSDLITSLIKTTSSILSFIITLILSSSVYAEDSLEASVDRNKLYLNESFNLKLIGNAKIDFSFGGLMSFGRNQVEAPVIEGLEESFEILDRQQNYSMRSINGDTTSEVIWNYTLSPKKAGRLTIPAAKFKSAQSQSIEIEVLKGKAPVNADNPPPVFFEVEVDKSDVYVQEQVKYTVRLYSLGRLSSGNLSEPTTSDAIVEVFGDESKYYRMAYNKRYEVIERNYLIFPQRSGSLEIPGLTLNGSMIDSYNRRRLRVAENSESITLNVSPPNSSFNGDQWLPAKSLHITEQWMGDNKDIKVGDAITREVTISALGLLGSALPPIPETNNNSVKAYPDKPVLESNLHEAGAQAFRKEATTFIAIKEGAITLPELRIHWWDTINDVARVATLPEKTINVKPSSPAQETNRIADLPAENLNPDGDISNPTSKQSVEVPNDNNDHALLSIISLLILGWLSTTWYLLQKLRLLKSDLNRVTIQQNNKPSESAPSFKQLVEALESNSPDMPKMVIQWFAMQSELSKTQINTINDLKEIEPEVAKHLEEFEQYKYGNASQTSFKSNDLIQKLKQRQQVKPENKTSNKTVLRPFYPQ